MTLRSKKLHLAAAVLALGLMTLSSPSAWAFTMENLSGGSADGSSRYSDPDGQVKNGMMPFGQGGPTVQFGAGSTSGAFSPLRPFNGFASPSQPPPEPYNLNNRN
jgi:hypothetical protein